MNDATWTQGNAQEHLAKVRRLSGGDLVAAARSYDWSRFPETVLGWIMAQKTVDLDTALAAFFDGQPERFNYLHKREVPVEFHGTCRLLDNICLRINSGFYLVRAGHSPSQVARLRKWIAVQEIDRREGSSGRWVLDEKIVAPLLSDVVTRAPQIEMPCEAVAEQACDVTIKRPFKAPRSPLARLVRLIPGMRLN